jgi:diguanylate cyclase (GGDEF)-like protein/PAS domain S-box-containing protein
VQPLKHRDPGADEVTVRAAAPDPALGAPSTGRLLGLAHPASEEGLPALLELCPDAMVIVDGLGAIVLLNTQTERLFGYRHGELVGEPIEELVPQRFRDRHSVHRERYGTDPHTRPMGVGLELYGRRKDGSEFPVEISLSPIQTESRQLVASAIRDITARKQAEEDASHYAAVVESSHDAIVGKDLDGTITSWNGGAERLYGYDSGEARGKSISILVPAGHDDDLPELLMRVRAGERVDDYETVRVRKDGTLVDVSLTVSPIRGRDGAVVGASTIARDISARLRYQAQLQFLAEHDSLTGARNRRRFERDLSDQVARARRYGEHAALLVLDVDDFKQINDVYGHRTGDRALKAIAAALTGRLRDTDAVARIGGDEFAVLLPYANENQAQVVARSLQDAITDCGFDTLVGLSVSIGLVLIDADTQSEEAAFAEADRAMYENKVARLSEGS